MNDITEQKTTITIEKDRQSFTVENSIDRSDITMIPGSIKLSAEKIIQE